MSRHLKRLLFHDLLQKPFEINRKTSIFDVQLYKKDSVNLVVDTSVIMAVLLNEKSKPKLIQLTRGKVLVAPPSLHWEIGNALSALHKRRRVTTNQFESILSSYKKIPLTISDVDLFESVLIAAKYNMYAYDAYFIECALRVRAPILTLDDVLKRTAEQIGIETVEI